MTIDYNRYYQDIESGVPAEELLSVIRKVEAYNRTVNILYVMTSRIIFREADSPPPEKFQWVLIDGNKSVTWPLWVSDDFSINLVFDGELVAVDSSGELIKDLKVELNGIKDPSEMMRIQYKESVCTLEDLYNSVFSQKDFFGIKPNSYWPEKADYNK